MTEKLDAGAQLVRKIDQTGAKLPAAFWSYEREISQWKLVLAMPVYDQEGPYKTYGFIQSVLWRAPKSLVSLEEIRAVSPNDPLVRALAKVVPTGQTFWNGRRVMGAYLDRIMIDEAFVYRMTRPRRGPALVVD